MRPADIPHTIRNINRLREIVTILSKYGLADWLSHSKIAIGKGFFKTPSGEVLSQYTREARIRLAITELGPTFIKLGQIFSTRPDIVGVKLAQELESLQTNVPADSGDSIRQIIANELGQPVEALFRDFDDKPIASASIGQVHRARLVSGEQVAVKVRHVGIETKVEDDLSIISWLAQIASHVPTLANYRPVPMVAEFQRTLRRELDFGREERNLQQFNQYFSSSDGVRVPLPFSDLCTSHVLTMEWLEGQSLRSIDQSIVDCEELAKRGAELYLSMVFFHGVYHADPHPGNLILIDEDIIGILDFGMIGRVDDDLRDQIESMLLAITDNDAQRLTSAIMRLGKTPENLDELALKNDVADFIGYYASQSLDELNLSEAFK